MVIVLVAAESVPISDEAPDVLGMIISNSTFLMDYTSLPAAPHSF